MKKLALLPGLFLMFPVLLYAQTVYQVSFKLTGANDSVDCKAFYANYDDSKGIVRLKYVSPITKENMLVEMDFIEEYADIKSDCYNNELVFYKLQKPKYIDGKDFSLMLPAYFCFMKNVSSGLTEPFGISNTPDTCKTPVAAFRSVEFMEQKDITEDFVLKYFKVQDKFYRNLFVNNNSRALTISEQNIKLMLLVVANVTDTIIGPAGRKDMNTAILFFKKITTFLGIQFVLIDSITGNKYNKQTVESTIKAIKPNPKDIVVFYYTGHGFRKPKDNRPPPYIDLRVNYKLSYMDNSLSMEDIFTWVKGRGARLNLVLSDCCNAIVTSNNPLANPQADPPATKKGFGINWSTENCRDLFLNGTPTSILATAAEPGQLATCNKTFGGFFSHFFRSALENHFSFFKNKVTWENVFAETKTQTKFKADHTYCKKPYTPQNICNQYPYVDIRYGRF